MANTALVALASGFEEIEAVTQIDVLRRAAVEVTVAGLDGLEITGSRGVTICADIALADVSETPDVLVLPGGMPGAENLGASAELEALAKRVLDEGGLLAAICAAPACTLAKWGLLEGCTATCYPSFESRFGDNTTFSENRVVVDGSIITSRGPGTAMEFALTIVEQLIDTETAAKLQAGMLVR